MNRLNRQQGITLIELMVVIVIMSILGTAATAIYTGYAERARVSRAIADIGEIHIALQKYLTNENRGYPATLAEAGLGDMVDPWGNPYQYLVVAGRADNGPVRKDKNSVPANSQYDIYSMGPDGLTETPFTSVAGRDDVVIANDGAYFGIAEDH
jgi:general secretion pathway protein G